MHTVLEFVLPGVEEPMMVMNNPPVTPHVGDLTPGPDGTIYRIVQRGFVIEKPSGIQLMGGTVDRGRVVIQCVIMPLQDPGVQN